MGVYAGPDVSENGLVLALDAGNVKGFDSNENLLTYTSNIGGPNGYLATTTATPNTTDTSAPDGTFTATKLDNAGNVNNYTYSQSTALSTNTIYTYSINIKQGTKPDFQITIDENSFGGKRYFSNFTYSTETITSGITGGVNDGDVIGSSFVKYSNGWYRLSITFRTSTTSVSTFVDMMNRFGNTPGTNYVWGRQLEKGSVANPYYMTVETAKNRGTTWTNLSSNGNNGTLTNGPTYNSANGGSIVFDGTNDYIDCGLASFQPTSISLCAWVSHTVSTDGGIIVKGDVNEATEWGLSFGYSAPHLLVGRATTFNNQLTYSWTGSLLTGFHYVCYTMVNNTRATLYVDGAQVASTNTIGSIGLNAKNVLIGKWNNYAPLNGSVSQVKIYGRELTAAEIQQNFNATKSRYGL